MEPFTMLVIAQIICSVGAILLSPRQKQEDAVAGTFDDGNLPLIEQGKPLHQVWGTCLIKSPAVVWWGNATTDPIYSKGGKK